MRELRYLSDPGTPEARALRARAGLPRWAMPSLIVVVLIASLVVFRLTNSQGEESSSGHQHEEASRVAEGARRIAVTAEGLRFDPDRISVKTGEDIAIALTSRDIVHDFVIDELDAHVSVKAGGTATGGFRADRPGRYTFYCSEPGHRAAGMKGELTVTGKARGDTQPQRSSNTDHDH